MIKKVLMTVVVALAVLCSSIIVLPSVGQVYAANKSICQDYLADPSKFDNVAPPGCETATAQDDFQTQVRVMINVILGVAGLIAVGFIIFGGFKYTTSAGDAAKVTSAKNTILYAVIGLVVAGLAFAIVNFVIRGLRF